MDYSRDEIRTRAQNDKDSDNDESRSSLIAILFLNFNGPIMFRILNFSIVATF